MTTLAQLADRAQNALNDAGAGTWTQAVVEEWCRDAIRDYSHHFLRTDEDTITCTAGTHYYKLNADYRGIISVEYPAGQDPPQYLTRLSITHPDFWDSDDHYDIDDYADNTDSAVIWISASPAAGDEILVLYTCPYTSAMASGTTIDVPPEHEPILILFVVWKAHVERLSTEAQNPDTTIRMLQQMKLAVQAAEHAYHQALRDAHGTRADGGWVAPWRSDAYDRVY